MIMVILELFIVLESVKWKANRNDKLLLPK